MRYLQMFLWMAIVGIGTGCRGGGVFVGSDMGESRSPDVASEGDVFVGGSAAGVALGLATGTVGPTALTDATISDLTLELNLASWGMLDAGDSGCEQAQLIGYHFENGFPIEMNYSQSASLPVLAAAPASLCGLYMLLEPRPATVAHRSQPALSILLSLSDGRTLRFTSTETIFLVAELDGLDPAAVQLQLDPLAWLQDVDLGALQYPDATTTINPQLQPELYAAVMSRLNLALIAKPTE